MSYQPNSHLCMKDCIILGNCAKGKCLIAAWLQGFYEGNLRGKEIDEEVANAIEALVTWSLTTNQV